MCARRRSTWCPTDTTCARASFEHMIEYMDDARAGSTRQEDAPAPAVGWASGPLGAVQDADREIARQTALRARAVAEFAATRPASADRQPGQPGAMSADRRDARPDVLADVSEWAAQELVVALSITARAAEDLLARSLTLVHRLPKTLAALECGSLHLRHLYPMLEKVAPVVDRRVRARLERDLLDWVAARDVTTPAQLGAKIRRELLARDVRSAARDLEAALRRRGVYARPDRVDGMATLSAFLTVPEAAALIEALGRYADAIEDDPDDGPPRTRQQKMADCLLDLVLRPGEADLPTVRTQLTLVAPIPTMIGGDQPGEIGGEPVPAEMVRALARGLGLVPDVPESASPSPPIDFDTDFDTEDDARAEALDRWWAAVDARAMRGEWGGEEEPPLEELERLWALAAQWSPRPDVTDVDWCEPAPTEPEPAPGGVTDTEPSWWAAADRAVDEASATLLDLDRKLARARRAVEAAEVADAADHQDWEQSPAGRVSVAPDALRALAEASTAQRAALRHLLESTGGGGLVDRPRIAVTDALTGALLALTDARELRARGTCSRRACRRGTVPCTHDLAGLPGLGPPGPSPTYRPGAVLDRHVRARDRRCRQPGCRNRVPRGGELDHHVPWPEGPTSAENLTGFCTSHHRGKHQAPGWQYELASAGTLAVSTPSGLTASTGPPPY
jgi:hypothetical protein